MKEKIYNHPLVKHAIDAFGEASTKVTELVGFLNRPEVNLDQVESIRLPKGDYIAQHGREAHSSLQYKMPESLSGISYALKRKLNPLHVGAGNVVSRPQEGFNTWDHGGYIISTVGLDMQGEPFAVHLPRSNPHRQQATEVANEIQTIYSGGKPTPALTDERAQELTAPGNQDAHLGHTMHMALVNASAGRMPIELAASLIDARAPLSTIAETIGLSGLSDPNNFRHYHKSNSMLASDQEAYRGHLDSLFRRMKRGMVIGETGKFGGGDNFIPGDSPYGPGPHNEADHMLHRPVAILNGRQVVPHPTFMLQDHYYYNVATSDYPKEYSWRWAQFQRAHDPGLPYFLDQMGPYFADSGVDPNSMRIPTNLTQAYVHQDVHRHLANMPYKRDEIEREVNRVFGRDWAGIMGWSMSNPDGNFPTDPDDARRWFDTNDYYIDD